jgi:hypothetical protein
VNYEAWPCCCCLLLLLLLPLLLPAQGHTQACILDALIIDFDSNAFSTQPSIFCAAASTCKELRAAAQLASANKMRVVLDMAAPLKQMRSFAF